MKTREKILASALKIFVKEGLAASTSSITKDARVSTGLLFHYFPTKNDLATVLYAKLLLEYYEVTNPLLREFEEFDAKKYYEVSRLSWESNVNWALDNWPKFLYVELFESSLLADQFDVAANQEVHALYTVFAHYGQLGVEHRMIKDLPADLRTELSRAITATTVKYLHANPKRRRDKELLQVLWKIHWNAVAL